MFPIQLILGIALLVLLGLYVRFFRRKPVRQAIFIIVVLTGMGFVLFPDVTTKIAELVGVGRGADLIFYIAIILTGFGFLHMYSRTKKLSEGLSEVVRRQAIAEAKVPE